MSLITSIVPAHKGRLPAGFACYPCDLCQTAIVVDDHAPETPTCRSCLRVGAESAIAEALGTLRELRAGTGVFAILSPAERAEQIGQLIGPVHAPTIIKAAMRTLSDQQLIDVVARTTDLVILGAATIELSRRLPATFDAPIYSSTPADAPDQQTRDSLESRIEVTIEPDGDYQDAERFDGLS